MYEACLIGTHAHKIEFLLVHQTKIQLRQKDQSCHKLVVEFGEHR